MFQFLAMNENDETFSFFFSFLDDVILHHWNPKGLAVVLFSVTIIVHNQLFSSKEISGHLRILLGYLFADSTHNLAIIALNDIMEIMFVKVQLWLYQLWIVMVKISFTGTCHLTLKMCRLLLQDGWW